MKTEFAELWKKLDALQLDAPEAAFPFSAKLAKENRWTPAFARRVVVEYKRFAFLSVAAGHPVAPSDTVDQAWHLHLNYTRDYWKTFCPEILGQPLHHQPGNGSPAEREKFHDWYGQTLASYRDIFQTEPPGDIWPSVVARRAAQENFVRVDTQAHWVIRKPSWRSLAPFAGAATAGVVLVCGCGAGAGDGLNPFDWRGPTFLVFFLAFAVVIFGVAAWLRHQLRRPLETDWQLHADLDAFALAYLNEGEVSAVNAAIVGLVAQRIFVCDSASRKLSVQGELPANAHLLERVLFSAARIPGGVPIKTLRDAVRPVVARLRADLQARGLVLPDAEWAHCRLTTLLLALTVPAVGLIKILVGVSRGRPVGFLVALEIISVIALLLLFARRPLRSRAGDDILAKFRTRHFKLRETLNKQDDDPQLAATAVGLFGVTVLDQTWMSSLRPMLRPPNNSGTSGGSSGCGSSCSGGGSSCSGGGGGSSCGGGGSGCGGCGGGH
ncbi:MAG: hypothetical protein RLZZ350_314 [Verrucomicrobiota bacterium]|jgi:uncharacterized protein (TIGR04222 family)